jgi:hypothetical protein
MDTWIYRYNTGYMVTWIYRYNTGYIDTWVYRYNRGYMDTVQDKYMEMASSKGKAQTTDIVFVIGDKKRRIQVQ